LKGNIHLYEKQLWSLNIINYIVIRKTICYENTIFFVTNTTEIKLLGRKKYIYNIYFVLIEILILSKSIKYQNALKLLKSTKY